MGDLYDTDILTWSERQATLLRRLAAGERVNEDPEWANIIEEVESVGRGDLHAVESLLTQALLHGMKARAWPNAPAFPHWRAEARLFLEQAADRITESMRQRLPVARIYRYARSGLPETMNGQLPQASKPEPQLTLDQLLSNDR